MAKSSITYTQDDDSSTPGTITLNGDSKSALGGPPSFGRLDNVGDLAFAEFDSDPTFSWVRVECIRTSKREMTVRVVVRAVDTQSGNPYSYLTYSPRENIVENVPINFK